MDLYEVLRRTWGVEEFAAALMFGHGSVRIDGYLVPAPWARDHWTWRQLSGRMLECTKGQVRIGGGRLIVHDEQLTLGG